MSRVLGGGERALPVAGAKKTTSRPKTAATVATSSAGRDYKIAAAVDLEGRRNALRKRREIEQSLKRGIIVKSTAVLYNSEEVTRVANGIIIQSEKVEEDKNGTSSAIGSMNDPRMGVVNLSSHCSTCGEINCPGHLGAIELNCMIINPQFTVECFALMRILCHSCSVPKITKLELDKLGLLGLPLKQQLKAIAKVCHKRDCISLKEQPEHGIIKPCSRNPVLSSESLSDHGVIKAAPSDNKYNAVGPYEAMSISEIYRVLNGMTLESCKLLGFGTEATKIPLGTVDPTRYAPFISHPRDMLMDKLVVMPNIARPAVREGNTEAPDLITHKYNYIVESTRGEVSRKGKSKERGSDSQVRATEVYRRIKSLYYTIPDDKVRGRDFQAVIRRIQGKDSIVRKNGMGKQNNFCGRGVAGCNPAAQFEWIGIPERMRKLLTTSVTVNARNRERLLALMRAGKVVSINPSDRDTTITWSENLKYNLNYGDKVNRFAQDGDWIMNNRQPSLHGVSMMAFRMYFHDGDTVIQHLSITTPFNMDFDGDEINVWKCQSPETVQECIDLLAASQNLMSVEKSMPVMGMVMNSVTAFYMLCMQGDAEVSPVLYEELRKLMTYREDLTSLDQRLERYGVSPRSGFGIVSMLFPPSFKYESGEINVLEGVVISGLLTKNNVGIARSSIIQELHKLYGSQRTSRFFTDAPFLMNKFIMEIGFTIGMVDCLTIDQDETGEYFDRNREEMKRENTRITSMVKGMGGPLTDPVAEGIRLRNIQDQTNAAAAVGQKLVKEMLKSDNAFSVQSKAKTKGSEANIGSSLGGIGQQNYKGKRLASTLSGGTRLLPTFDRGDNSPQAHAFIPSSFVKGVTPSEFMFLMMGSREGQLDTANEVQKTGTIQHRMIKAGENTLVDADGSLRNNGGVIFMTLYNNGFNPAAMVPGKLRGRDVLVPFDLAGIITRLNSQRGWVTPKVADLVQKRLEKRYGGAVPATYKPPVREAVIPEEVVAPGTPQREGQEIEVDSTVTFTHRDINRFEKARLLSVRAEMLDAGATPLVQVTGDFDPHAVAEAEYQLGVIPLFVIRKYPDGSHLKIHPNAEFLKRLGLTG